MFRRSHVRARHRLFVSSPDEDDKRSDSSSCAHYLDHLISIGVRLVVLDFDSTIIDVHTSGRWKESAKSLSKHVRPVFLALMKAVIEQKGLYLAIATQSPQTDLIRKVLKERLPFHHKEIIIKGEDRTWERVDGIPKGGKQQHIEAVKRELDEKCHVQFSSNEILLIDDDFINVGIALSYDFKAITFEKDESIEKILNLTRESAKINADK